MAEMPSSSRLTDNSFEQSNTEMNGVVEQTKKKNLSICVQCEKEFSQENLPKLLPCLHTCCQTCIAAQTDEEVDKEKGKDITWQLFCIGLCGKTSVPVY